MSVGIILLIVFMVLFIATIPKWRHSQNWGYGPSGGFGVAVIVVLGLLIMRRL